MDSFPLIDKASSKISSDPNVMEEHDHGNQGAKLEHFLTVSKIVEQKEVFEKRFKYRKVSFIETLFSHLTLNLTKLGCQKPQSDQLSRVFFPYKRGHRDSSLFTRTVYSQLPSGHDKEEELPRGERLGGLHH